MSEKESAAVLMGCNETEYKATPENIVGGVMNLLRKKHLSNTRTMVIVLRTGPRTLTGPE